MILPTAPKSFYEPSLETLKDDLERSNGLTTGQVSLITAPPVDIEAAWDEVGSGNHNEPSNEVGTLVVGVADITTILGPVIGPEEVPGETGYKLQFESIPEVEIKIDGTGVTTRTIVGVAFLVGRNLFSDGSDLDVKYIAKIQDLLVTDGSLISLPDWELIINYAVVPLSGANAAVVIA